jgi:hypothetical protein
MDTFASSNNTGTDKPHRTGGEGRWGGGGPLKAGWHPDRVGTGAAGQGNEIEERAGRVRPLQKAQSEWSQNAKRAA